MKILDRIKNLIRPDVKVTGTRLMSTTSGGSFYYDGSYYKSDLVRACIRPFANAAGKLEPKHILRNAAGEITGKSDKYIRDLLKNPNRFMTGQVLLTKLANQYMLNNNAFLYVKRNVYGLCESLFPIPAYSVKKDYDENGRLFLEFSLKNNNSIVLSYDDVIHLRQDFTDEDDIFGESPADVLTDLMTVIKTSDNSIVSAVKNGGTLKWLLSITQTLKPEDLKKRAKAFEEDFLRAENGESSVVAAQDSTQKLEQLKPNDYVPDADLRQNSAGRIMAYFGTNENIITSKYTEDEYQSYFEAVIEPFAKQLSEEFTRKIFRPYDLDRGNEIIFDATSLQFATMATKLNLLQMVDRGALTPNEWRKSLNLPPIEGGDTPVRRLDTATVKTE